MTLNINQFKLSTVQGQLDMETQGTVVSAQVDAAQSGSLVAGQAVKLATTSGGVPKVLALASNSEAAFGFIVRNLKDINDPASAAVEVAMFGSIMWMTAGAAITRGASIEVVQSTNKVITSAGTNPVVGLAYDSAAADGDLIRVLIQAPYSAPSSNLTQRVQSIDVTSTLAEINAGKVLIPGITGEKITVLSYIGRVTGNFAAGTSVELESTNGTPVAVSTIAEAGLTNGAILLPASANTTLGAGFGKALGTSDGLQVVNNGSAQTTGTSIEWTITFVQA